MKLKDTHGPPNPSSVSTAHAQGERMGNLVAFQLLRTGSLLCLNAGVHLRTPFTDLEVSIRV